MTATCMHPTPRVANPSGLRLLTPTRRVWHGLAQLGAWVTERLHTWQAAWRQTDALSHMDAHQLRDIGAPPWLAQRAQSHQDLERYEHFRATSRLKY